jgi:osmotically-inducible protein OsmY
MSELRLSAVVLATAALAGVLAGCSPRSENKPADATVTSQAASEPVSTASGVAATASAALDKAADNIKEAAGEAKDKMATAADSAGDKASASAGTAGDKIAAAAAATKEKAGELAADAKDLVGDAAVTARVKTTLAADAKLSAMDINVDTKDGVVTLKGTAPDAAARNRATEVVKGLKGVTKVDNQLKAAS